MKAWTVKFKSYNKKDYCETVSGKDENDARKNAQRGTIKHDDRDRVEWIKEDLDANMPYPSNLHSPN